jgi:hypothetical protein
MSIDGCWFAGIASALRNLSVLIRWVLVGSIAVGTLRDRVLGGSILRGEALPTNVEYNRARAKKTNKLCHYN